VKVAISTDMGHVSAHFGRCASYTIVDIQEGQVASREEIPNPGHQPGFLPQFLSERGVSIIIAGGMGPRAQGLFAQKNIETLIGVQGPIDTVITQFLKQDLEVGEDLCGHKHGPAEGSDNPIDQPSLSQSEGSVLFITATGKDLDAEIDPRFGRAPYFLVVQPDSQDFEVFANPNIDAAGGVGIQSAQFAVEKKASVVITGQCGPNAERVLSSSGIRIVNGAKGKVKDAIQQFLKEDL
ncbi:MAG: NifB/NifX family molybdenum-iron cluster-binding protein, partial [Candidatus Aminicenantes bacterium]